MRKRKGWTPEQKKAASDRAKARAAQTGGSSVLEAAQASIINEIPAMTDENTIIHEHPEDVRSRNDSEIAALQRENERLKAEIARQTLGMTVSHEEAPPTPAKFIDNEQWHFYLCIKSKADEEDEEAEKCSKDPEKGGYEMAPGGRLSSRKVWLRIPQALFKSRKQAAVDESRARWMRPEGQDVRDVGLKQTREQREQFVGAGSP